MLFKVFLFLAYTSIWVEAIQKTPIKVLKKSKLEVIPDTVTVPHTKLNDENLIVNVTVYDKNMKQVGKKPFRLLLDTMTDSFWIVGKDCTSSFCAKKDQRLAPENDKSTTISRHLVEGITDTYTIKFDGIEETRSADIVAATSIDYSLASRLDSSIDGVLGLRSSEFKKWLKPDGIGSLVSVGKDAALYFGVPNELVTNNIYSNAPMVHTNSPNLWKIHMNYVSNSRGIWKTWCKFGCTAILDSTLSQIIGPATDINSINAYIGTDENGEIDCDKVRGLQPIVFGMSSGRFSIEAKNYILEPEDQFSSKCRSAFVVQNSGKNLWRIGLPIFNQFLTVFDFNDDGITFLNMK